MEFKARLKDLSRNMDGEKIVSFTVQGNAEQMFDEFRDKELSITVKPYRKSRSMNANSYFWVLLDKLTEYWNNAKLAVTKEDLYKDMIKGIGGNSVIMPVMEKQKEQAMSLWKSHGLGWVCEDTGSSKIDGCTNIIFYAGSSVYDTAQMSRLIDRVVADCKEVGIETLTPEQLELLKEEWK